MQKGRDGHVFNVKWNGHHFVFIDSEGNERLNYMPFPIEKHLSGIDFEDRELISSYAIYVYDESAFPIQNSIEYISYSI